MQHAGGASRASMLRRRGAGTLLAFGDHSPALVRCDVAVPAIIRPWALGISSNVQAHPLHWLAYRRSWLDLSRGRRQRKGSESAPIMRSRLLFWTWHSRRGGLANPEQAMWVGANYGPTTDHHGRTQRTSTVNRGRQRAVVHARQPSWPDLGVKGSRVQISPARLSKLTSQAAFSAA